MPTALTTEYLTHCTAILDALQHAGVQTIPPSEEEEPLDMTLVLLRPAFQAMRVAQAQRRAVETQLWRDGACLLLPVVDTAWRACCVPLRALCTALVVARGRHPACIRFVGWHAKVVAALMSHGTYDPASNHAPAPGDELDALERREEMRDLWRESFPALAEAFDRTEDDHVE